jgi:hypothetical protein
VANDPQASAHFSAKSKRLGTPSSQHLNHHVIDEQSNQALIAMAFLDDVTPSVT